MEYVYLHVHGIIQQCDVHIYIYAGIYTRFLMRVCVLEPWLGGQRIPAALRCRRGPVGCKTSLSQDVARLQGSKVPSSRASRTSERQDLDIGMPVLLDLPYRSSIFGIVVMVLGRNLIGGYFDP